MLVKLFLPHLWRTPPVDRLLWVQCDHSKVFTSASTCALCDQAAPWIDNFRATP